MKHEDPKSHDNPGGKPENDKKITLTVIIEGDRNFTDEYVIKQKIQVVASRTLEHFNLNDGEDRVLTRIDGTVINDFQLTIEELNLRDGESLKYLRKKAPTPDKPKKFA